jgi:hypothetical protein
MKAVLALLLFVHWVGPTPIGAPNKSWWDSLQSEGAKQPCCDIADGQKVEDVDWDMKGDHYRVRLNGQWITVPSSSVVTTPNRFGPAVVWPYTDASGQTVIRCFLPSSMS